MDKLTNKQTEHGKTEQQLPRSKLTGSGQKGRPDSHSTSEPDTLQHALVRNGVLNGDEGAGVLDRGLLPHAPVPGVEVGELGEVKTEDLHVAGDAREDGDVGNGEGVGEVLAALQDAVPLLELGEEGLNLVGEMGLGLVHEEDGQGEAGGIQLGGILEEAGDKEAVVLVVCRDQGVMIVVLVLQVHQDGLRLGDGDVAILVDGQLVAGVDGEELGRLVFALQQADLLDLGLETLLVEVDGHTPGVVGGQVGVVSLLAHDCSSCSCLLVWE